MAERRQPIRIDRRRFLALSSATGTGLVLAGCDLNGSSNPTGTAVPTGTSAPDVTDTPVLTPTATQETITTPVAGYQNAQKWAGRTLTVAAWGGDYQEAQEAAYFDPFATDTGVSVQLKIADTERFRDQV